MTRRSLRAVLVAAGALLAAAAIAAAAPPVFPAEDVYLYVPKSHLACAWEKVEGGGRIGFCEPVTPGPKLGMTIGLREVSLFRKERSGTVKFLKRWLHTRAPKGSSLSRARVAGRPSGSSSRADRTFPASGRYVYVPQTPIGCTWGDSNGDRLAICQISQRTASYAFSVSAKAVTVFYYKAGSTLPQAVYRRAQP